MFKKILLPILLITSFSSFAQTEKDIKECFIKGQVQLPNHFFKEIYINIFGETTEIDKNGFYCIKKEFKMRDKTYIQVFYKKNLILQNRIFDKKFDNLYFDISLEKAMAEVVCNDKLCNLKEYKHNLTSEYVKEYSNKVKEKYYNKTKKIDFEKIIKKMSQQDRKVRQADKKQIKTVQSDYYYDIKEQLRVNDYNNFNYKKSDKKKYLKAFLNNNEQTKGLDSVHLPVEVILSEWLRQLYYFGNDLKVVGKLYSTELKDTLIETEKLESILLFSNGYQSNARKGNRVRNSVDEKFYKKTIFAMEGMFKKDGDIIFNINPNYVDIQFIFEDNAWRLNTFKVNERFISELENK